MEREEKLAYESPETEIIDLENEDIITDSQGGEVEPGTSVVTQFRA